MKIINGPIRIQDGSPEFVLVDYAGPTRRREEIAPSLHRTTAQQKLTKISEIQTHIKNLVLDTNSLLGSSYPTQTMTCRKPESIQDNYRGPIAILLPEIHIDSVHAQELGIQVPASKIQYSNAQILYQLCMNTRLNISNVLLEGASCPAPTGTISSNLSGELVNRKGTSLAVRDVLGMKAPEYCAAESIDLILRETVCAILRYSAILMELRSPAQKRTQPMRQMIQQMQVSSQNQGSGQVTIQDTVNKFETDLLQSLVLESNNVVNLINGSNDTTSAIELLGRISDNLIKQFGLEKSSSKYDLRFGMEEQERRVFTLPIEVPCFTDVATWQNLDLRARELLLNSLHQEETRISQLRDVSIAETITSLGEGLLPMVIGGRHIENLVRELNQRNVPVIVIKCY